MTTALAIVLLLNAVFNAIVWPAFYRRVVKDPRSRDDAGKATRFLLVHVVIFTVALVLALVSAILGAMSIVAG